MTVDIRIQKMPQKSVHEPVRKRIFVDARMINHTGIGRHIRGHLRHLSRQGHILIASASHTEQKNTITSIDKEIKIIPYPAHIYSFKEQVVGSLICNQIKSDVDIFWFPQFNVPMLVPDKFIMTVHDLIQFDFSRKGLQRAKVPIAEAILRRASNRAWKIICVSDYTRKELIKRHPNSEGKISVIPNGISDFWKNFKFSACHELRDRYNLDRFFLAVGNKRNHKNFPFLLRIIDELAPKYENLKMVIVGSRTDEWVKSFQDWKSLSQFSERVIDLEKICDTELRAFYSCADIFLMPSLCEGFGIPPLEAMSASTPVISSCRGGLPEAVGDAGVLLDPTDIELWKTTAEKMLTCEDTRNDYIRRGLERAQSFEWEEVSPAFEKVLNGDA